MHQRSSVSPCKRPDNARFCTRHSRLGMGRENNRLLATFCILIEKDRQLPSPTGPWASSERCDQGIEPARLSRKNKHITDTPSKPSSTLECPKYSISGVFIQSAIDLCKEPLPSVYIRVTERMGWPFGEVETCSRQDTRHSLCLAFWMSAHVEHSLKLFAGRKSHA
jgi:hypothetical protein